METDEQLIRDGLVILASLITFALVIVLLLYGVFKLIVWNYKTEKKRNEKYINNLYNDRW